MIVGEKHADEASAEATADKKFAELEASIGKTFGGGTLSKVRQASTKISGKRQYVVGYLVRTVDDVTNVRNFWAGPAEVFPF